MIRGLDGFAARINGAKAAVDVFAERGLEQSAREAMELARELAPVGTGERRERRLVDSFSYEVKGLTAVMQVENPHAAYVEFGTGRRGAASADVAPVAPGYDGDWPGMAAQPYMYPAAQRMRAVFPTRMAEAVRGALRERRSD